MNKFNVGSKVLSKIQLALMVLIIGLFPIAPSLQSVVSAVPQERVLSTGIADSTNAQGAKWRKISFTAQRTGSATFKLSWTGTSDMRFQILRSNDTVIGGNITASRQSPKTYTTNLTAGTSYFATVWAYSGVANYTFTITEDFPVTDTQAPTAPSNLSVTNTTTNSVALQWSASSDNIATTGYRIYRNNTQVGTSGSLNYLDQGLNEGTDYSYYVRAFDAAGNLSDVSNTVLATTGITAADTEAPTKPESLVSPSQTSNSIVLSWNISTDNIGVTEYLVYRNGSLVADPIGNSFTDSGLAAETSYAYQVAAVDAAGNMSELSDELTVQTSPAPTTRPNIVFINLDDMRPDQLQYMPKTLQWFGAQGTTFPNAYVSTPSCCPSRATMMSGRYVHNNGQYNQDNQGADINLMVQRYLKEAGYFTGHSGKFLHWLPLSTVAPYWDRWTYFKGDYVNVPMNWDGRTLTTQGYSTTITFDRAIDYLNDFETRNDSTPFYMQLTPIAPHGPSTPEAKYANTAVPAIPRVPSHDETDRTDKPNFVSYTKETYTAGNSRNTAMARVLFSADDQIDRFMTELQNKGELDNTLAIFTADNGYFLGEHGRSGKFLPYKEAVKVPLMMRWPGKIAAGATDNRMVAHVDLAPTLLAAAGTSQNYVQFDGHDILSGYSRPVGLTEYYYDTANANFVTTWAAIHTPQYVYVEYYGNGTSTSIAPTFREYYDMVNDPYQMQNLLKDSTTANDPNVAELSQLLASQKNCSGSACL